jgi:hypothetical protein
MTARYEFALKGRRHLPKPYHFKASGLPNVYLLSGVKIERDPKYGELVTIDHLRDLITAIAFSLVATTERLTGAETRFLRKRMGATQSDLGAELWVSEQQSVCRFGSSEAQTQHTSASPLIVLGLRCRSTQPTGLQGLGPAQRLSPQRHED